MELHGYIFRCLRMTWKDQNISLLKHIIFQCFPCMVLHLGVFFLGCGAMHRRVVGRRAWPSNVLATYTLKMAFMLGGPKKKLEWPFTSSIVKLESPLLNDFEFEEVPHFAHKTLLHANIPTLGHEWFHRLFQDRLMFFFFREAGPVRDACADPWMRWAWPATGAKDIQGCQDENHWCCMWQNFTYICTVLYTTKNGKSYHFTISVCEACAYTTPLCSPFWQKKTWSDPSENSI